MRASMLALMVAGAALADPSDLVTPAIPLWPWPEQVVSGTGVVGISSKTFAFAAGAGTSANSPVLAAALKRYEGFAFGPLTTVSGGRAACPRAPDALQATAPPAGPVLPPALTSLVVTISLPDAGPSLDMDESYELHVPNVAGAAALKANTAVGALRGLETFYQLMQFGRRKGQLVNNDFCDYVILAAPLNITDKPRFTHRGLLVDTGRDYHTPAFLKKTIASLSWNKMSVLHWHINEVDSFPLVLDSVPELAAKGAFSTNQVYTKADVADIVAHGRLHGVRVMPEIEMPGHMSAYQLALPGLNLTIDTGSRHGQAAYDIANFASPNLLPTMAKVVEEAAGMFEDELFFFGGDETACPYNQ